MGRLHKFKTAEVVTFEDRPAVVVDYRQSGRGQGQYRVVRLHGWPAGQGYGPAVWINSDHLDHFGDGRFRRFATVRKYRANAKLVERGCRCECCVHEAIPPAAVLGDGTRKDEV
jgi:hypothetical protein